MKNLIKYENTPQVTALEYHEMRDLEKHPEKREYYDNLIFIRTGKRPVRK